LKALTRAHAAEEIRSLKMIIGAIHVAQIGGWPSVTTASLEAAADKKCRKLESLGVPKSRVSEIADSANWWS
jgi:hypothetical protein